MKNLSLLIAAAAGGGLVYWWIKRTCPCQHEDKPAIQTAPAPSSSSSDELDEGPAGASALGGGAAGDLFATNIAQTTDEAIGGDLFPGSSSGTFGTSSSTTTATSGCRTCPGTGGTQTGGTRDTSILTGATATDSFGGFTAPTPTGSRTLGGTTAGTDLVMAW